MHQLLINVICFQLTIKKGLREAMKKQDGNKRFKIILFQHNIQQIMHNYAHQCKLNQVQRNVHTSRAGSHLSYTSYTHPLHSYFELSLSFLLSPTANNRLPSYGSDGTNLFSFSLYSVSSHPHKLQKVFLHIVTALFRKDHSQ